MTRPRGNEYLPRASITPHIVAIKAK